MESEYITLKDLVEAKHPYYCSDTNFYSNDAGNLKVNMSSPLGNDRRN